MSSQVHSAKKIYPAHGDAIRIVPLSLPDAMRRPVQPLAGAAPAAAPQLTYRNGPLMTAVEVFTIYWGSEWQTGALSAVPAQINAFFDFILTSPLIDQLAEYSVPNWTIGHGKRSGTLTVTTPQPKASMSDTAIQHTLQQLISGHPQVPPPSPNTLYFIYMPTGVRVVQGGAASCQSFCGYHNDISGQIFYAVMPYPDCAGCMGTLSTFEALTTTSSHELCESITDPIPGQGWYDDTNGEIGDICAWKTKQLGSYTVQLEWSNKANQCI
ncbi:MAG TPA: hypothetical protein VH278_18280 [Burkholderiaceae bacterium]|nr:hypothetical protein [Burkholderiaceae bacterium]